MSKKVRIIGIIISLWMLVTLILAYQNAWTGWIESGLELKPLPPSITGGGTSGGFRYDITYYLGNWDQFAYFTTLTGLITLITMIVVFIFNIKISSNFKMAVSLYTLVTAILFWTSMAPFIDWSHSKPWSNFSNANEHISILFASFLLVFGTIKKKIKSNKEEWMKMLIFPIVYLIFSIIFYSSTNGYGVIYPFLDFLHPFGLTIAWYWSILISISIITIALIGFIFVYKLMVWLANKKLLA